APLADWLSMHGSKHLAAVSTLSESRCWPWWIGSVPEQVGCSSWPTRTGWSLWLSARAGIAVPGTSATSWCSTSSGSRPEQALRHEVLTLLHGASRRLSGLRNERNTVKEALAHGSDQDHRSPDPLESNA